MAASVDSAAPAPAPPPPPVPAVAAPVEEGEGDAEQARTLIGALNLLSRNLPLPPAVLRAVSSIYHEGDQDEEDEEGDHEEEPAVAAEPADAGTREGEEATLLQELEDAIFGNQTMHMSSSKLIAVKEERFNTSIQHRLAELEGLPSTRGEDLQMKCLLELYGLNVI